MRSPYIGENAKLALVGIASIATIGLFTVLASNEPERFLRPARPLPSPSPLPPSLELRRAPAEPDATLSPPQTGAGVATTPVETPQADLGADEGVAPESAAPDGAAIEKAVAKDAPASAPRSKRRIGRGDVEASAPPGRRPSTGRDARKRAFDDMLPNKKGAAPEVIRLEEPRDPLSDFIEGF